MFKNMACSKVWRQMSTNHTQDTYSVPSEKGNCSRLCHIGSNDTGLLSGSMLLFRYSKSNSSYDYHTEMNRDVFSHWRLT